MPSCITKGEYTLLYDRYTPSKFDESLVNETDLDDFMNLVSKEDLFSIMYRDCYRCSDCIKSPGEDFESRLFKWDRKSMPFVKTNICDETSKRLIHNLLRYLDHPKMIMTPALKASLKGHLEKEDAFSTLFASYLETYVVEKLKPVPGFAHLFALAVDVYMKNRFYSSPYDDTYEEVSDRLLGFFIGIIKCAHKTIETKMLYHNHKVSCGCHFGYSCDCLHKPKEGYVKNCVRCKYDEAYLNAYPKTRKNWDISYSDEDSSSSSD